MELIMDGVCCSRFGSRSRILIVIIGAIYLNRLIVKPGRLCAALHIDKSCYGANLEGDELFLLDDGAKFANDEIAAVPRINVAYAGEDALQPWRFLLKSNPFISIKPKRGA